MTDKEEEYLVRFGLTDGQFFGVHRYKNLHWFVNDFQFGYGDLKTEHIKVISKELNDGEEFLGWNEHHGTEFQQTDEPMIRITKGVVIHRAPRDGEG